MLKKLLINSHNIRRFCLFQQQISEQYGQKCCRYGQNGQPMPQSKAQQTFMKGWKLQQQGKRLIKHYYAQDYPQALRFLQELVTIDMNEFKQCPTYHMTNGQILCLEVYSTSLKGLSMIDFQLAMRINNIPYKQFSLIELDNVQNYKKQISKVKMARQSARIQKMLAEDEKNWDKKQ